MPKSFLLYLLSNPGVVDAIVYHLDSGSEGCFEREIEPLESLILSCRQAFKVFYPIYRFKCIQTVDLPLVIPGLWEEVSARLGSKKKLSIGFSVKLCKSLFKEDQEFFTYVSQFLRVLTLKMENSWYMSLPCPSTNCENMPLSHYYLYLHWFPFLHTLNYNLRVPIDLLKDFDRYHYHHHHHHHHNSNKDIYNQIENDPMWMGIRAGTKFLHIVPPTAATNHKETDPLPAVDKSLLKTLTAYMDLFPQLELLTLPFTSWLEHVDSSTILTSEDSSLGEDLVRFFSYLNRRKISLSSVASPGFASRSLGISNSVLILDEFGNSSLPLFQLTDPHFRNVFFEQESRDSISNEQLWDSISNEQLLSPLTHITSLFDTLQIHMTAESFCQLFPLKETFPTIRRFSWKGWIPAASCINADTSISFLTSIVPFIRSHRSLTSFELSDVYISEKLHVDGSLKPIENTLDESVDCVRDMGKLYLESVHLDLLNLSDLSRIFPDLQYLTLNGVTFQAFNDCLGYPSNWSKLPYRFDNLHTFHLELGWNPWCFSTNSSLWLSYWFLYHDLLSKRENAPNLAKLELVILDSPPVSYLISWFFHLKDRFRELESLSVTVVIPLESLNARDYDPILIASNLKAYHALQLLFKIWKPEFQHLQNFSLISE